MIKAYDADNLEHTIDIIKERDHYTVEVDHHFYCSCDSQKEVDAEIPAVIDLFGLSFVKEAE